MDWNEVIAAISAVLGTLIITIPIVRAKYLALKDLLRKVVAAIEDDNITEAEWDEIMAVAKKVIWG